MWEYQINKIKTLYVFVFFLVVLLILTGCATQRVDIRKDEIAEQRKPYWVLSGIHPQYSSPRYIVGVGLSKKSEEPITDRKTADYDAFAEISQQILAHITDEVIVIESEIVENKIYSTFQMIVADTRVNTSLEISGLKIVERYLDPVDNVYYSFAVLDRVTAAEPSRLTLLDLRNKYETSLRNAEQSLSEGRLTESLYNLKTAYHSAIYFKLEFPKFQLIASLEMVRDIRTPMVPSPVHALDLLTDYLSRVELSIMSGDEQSYIYGKGFVDPLIIEMTVRDAQSILIRNFPVHYQFERGRGEITGQAFTNTNGHSAAEVREITRSPEKVYTVSAVVSFDRFRDTGRYAYEWNKRLETGKRREYFNFERMRVSKPLRIGVIVEEKTPIHRQDGTGRYVLMQEFSEVGLSPFDITPVRDRTTAIIREAIRDGRFSIVRRELQGIYDYFVYGEISINFHSERQGVKTYNVGGSVKAISVSDEKIIGSESFQHIRGFGITEEQAVENALREAAFQASDTILGEILTKYQ